MIERNLLDLLAEHGVTVKRSGRNHVTLCPFHDDHNPSMLVSPRRYTCLACGAKGDTVDMYAHLNGMSRGQAYLVLYPKGGGTDDVSLMNISLQENLHSRATLLEEAQALGFNPEMMSSFKIGLYHDVTTHLEVRKRLGMGRHYYGRLTIPLIDHRRRIVGYQCRSLDGTLPKYLNSLNTEDFTKSEYLYDSQNYGLNTSQGELVIVEGIKDAMITATLGYRTLSTLGTNISEKQMRLIAWKCRDFKRIIVCYDMDTPGQGANYRLLKGLSYTLRKKTYVLNLHQYKDPCELISLVGRSGFLAAVMAAKTSVDWIASYERGLSDSSIRRLDRSPIGKNIWERELIKLNETGSVPDLYVLVRWAYRHLSIAKNSSLLTSRRVISQVRLISLGQYLYTYMMVKLPDSLAYYHPYYRIVRVYQQSFTHVKSAADHHKLPKVPGKYRDTD